MIRENPLGVCVIHVALPSDKTLRARPIRSWTGRAFLQQPLTGIPILDFRVPFSIHPNAILRSSKLQCCSRERVQTSVISYRKLFCQIVFRRFAGTE